MEKELKVVPPPIHEHYNEETDQSELCGYVFCPYGFVGIEKITNQTLN